MTVYRVWVTAESCYVNFRKLGRSETAVMDREIHFSDARPV